MKRYKTEVTQKYIDKLVLTLHKKKGEEIDYSDSKNCALAIAVKNAGMTPIYVGASYFEVATDDGLGKIYYVDKSYEGYIADDIHTFCTDKRTSLKVKYYESREDIK